MYRLKLILFLLGVSLITLHATESTVFSRTKDTIPDSIQLIKNYKSTSSPYIDYYNTVDIDGIVIQTTEIFEYLDKDKIKSFNVVKDSDSSINTYGRGAPAYIIVKTTYKKKELQKIIDNLKYSPVVKSKKQQEKELYKLQKKIKKQKKQQSSPNIDDYNTVEVDGIVIKTTEIFQYLNQKKIKSFNIKKEPSALITSGRDTPAYITVKTTYKRQKLLKIIDSLEYSTVLGYREDKTEENKNGKPCKNRP